MSYDLLLEKKKTVPVKVPVTVHKWLEELADKENMSIPLLVLKWIMDLYGLRDVIPISKDVIENLKKTIMQAYNTESSQEGNTTSRQEDKSNFRKVVNNNLISEKGPEDGAPQRNVGEETTNSEKVERFYFNIADRDPMRALLLLFGSEEAIPDKKLFGSMEMLLIAKGFSKTGAKRFLRKLIDKGIYKQNASLLVLNRRERDE